MALFISHCILVDERLFYTGPSQTFMRMVTMTEQERTDVLTECHDRSNHNGVRGTRNRVVASYYWLTITQDVEAWVRIILGYDIPCKVFAAFDPSEKLVSQTHTHTYTHTESCKLTGADIGIQPCPLSIRFYVNWFLI